MGKAKIKANFFLFSIWKFSLTRCFYFMNVDKYAETFEALAMALKGNFHPQISRVFVNSLHAFVFHSVCIIQFLYVKDKTQLVMWISKSNRFTFSGLQNNPNKNKKKLRLSFKFTLHECRSKFHSTGIYRGYKNVNFRKPSGLKLISTI